jgi:tetratricopeptide (TPR) repeat protein
MGGNNGESDEKPVHQVTVSGFYMGKYEVTQKEYRELMGTNPSNFKGDNLPVENVSWHEAIEYCNKRSRKEGLTAAYTVNGTNVTWNRNANGYRLPTEAEWEYACRAGTTTAYNTGASINDNIGWYGDNSGDKTHPVGQKPANAWSLYDMHGNVWEWCWDRYGDYSSGAQMDPVGASSGPDRVSRGGGWRDYAVVARSAYRDPISPTFQSSSLGFRLARSVVDIAAQPAQQNNKTTQSVSIPANVSIEKGIAYYNNDEYDQAIVDFTRAINVNPNSSLAYYYRGSTYQKIKNYDHAIADYTQVIRIDPNDAVAYNNRANAYFDKNDYDNAIADYTQAIRITPNDAVAYNNRAIAYRYKNDYDNAISDYNQVIRIDPNDSDAYYWRGNAYELKGDIAKANTDKTKAQELRQKQQPTQTEPTVSSSNTTITFTLQ